VCSSSLVEDQMLLTEEASGNSVWMPSFCGLFFVQEHYH